MRLCRQAIEISQRNLGMAKGKTAAGSFRTVPSLRLSPGCSQVRFRIGTSQQPHARQLRPGRSGALSPWHFSQQSPPPPPHGDEVLSKAVRSLLGIIHPAVLDDLLHPPVVLPPENVHQQSEGAVGQTAATVSRCSETSYWEEKKGQRLETRSHGCVESETGRACWYVHAKVSSS